MACWSRSLSRFGRSAAPNRCARRLCFVMRSRPNRFGRASEILIALGLVAAALFALAVLGAEAKKLAAYFTLAVDRRARLSSSRLACWLRCIARKVKRPRRPELAIALGNIGAPGGLARSVVLSLGTGLTLLVAVSLVDRSITGELEGRIPATSPNYFVLDIKKAELAELRSARAQIPAAMPRSTRRPCSAAASSRSTTRRLSSSN